MADRTPQQRPLPEVVREDQRMASGDSRHQKSRLVGPESQRIHGPCRPALQAASTQHREQCAMTRGIPASGRDARPRIRGCQQRSEPRALRPQQSVQCALALADTQFDLAVGYLHQVAAIAEGRREAGEGGPVIHDPLSTR